MARSQSPSLVVQDLDCPPCMLCIYQPEHPPSIEAMGFWGKQGVFSLESEMRLDSDGSPRRVWKTPPQWPVRCCREEDLKILEMVDPAVIAAAPSVNRGPGSLSR